MGQRQSFVNVFRKERFAEDVLQRTKHQCEGRAEFMRDIREERDLRTINFRERFGSFSFFFKSTRVCDCGRDLSGSKFDETQIRVVEPETRADSRDQYAGRLMRDVR